MSSPVAARMNRIKPGMCPHGMPAGSCPICNGMGGGATANNKRLDVRKVGEMSWSECFAMGLRMKADKMHKQQIIQDRRDAHLALLRLQEQISDKLLKMGRLAEMFSKFVPKVVVRPLTNIVRFIGIPLLKFAQVVVGTAQNIVVNLSQFVRNMKENIQGVQEKLAAIFGEFLNAKEKSLEERFKLARKKVFAFFFGKTSEDEEIEIKEIEKQEMELELKKVKDSLMNLNKYKKEVDDERNSAV